MDKKKSLLTESSSSCGWLAVGLMVSIFVIFLTGASEQYPAFYSSASIQILNSLAMYLGVTRKTHEKPIAIVAGIIKVVMVPIGLCCIAYFYLLANTPSMSSDAYNIYEFLLTPKATYILSGFFLIPLGECVIEYIIHICLTPSENS